MIFRRFAIYLYWTIDYSIIKTYPLLCVISFKPCNVGLNWQTDRFLFEILYYDGTLCDINGVNYTIRLTHFEE